MQVLDGVGASFHTVSGLAAGRLWYSGKINYYDSSQLSGFDFTSGAFCLIAERNGLVPTFGRRYAGQLVDYAGSTTHTAPLYLIEHSILNVICDPVSGLIVIQ